MKRFLFALGVILLFVFGGKAHAIEVDNSASVPNVFRYESKLISPTTAQELGNQGKEIERCTVIKGGVGLDGKETKAFRCSRVKLVINGKSGTTKWMRL